MGEVRAAVPIAWREAPDQFVDLMFPDSPSAHELTAWLSLMGGGVAGDSPAEVLDPPVKFRVPRVLTIRAIPGFQWEWRVEVSVPHLYTLELDLVRVDAIDGSWSWLVTGLGPDERDGVRAECA